ncbi:MAG: outer membrane beta-barrel protein [Pseudolabrys sp.]
MKKKLLLSVAFFGAAAAVNSSALAAPPMYSWTGCYVGLNAGYSWGRASVDGNATGLASLGLPTAFSTTLNPDGFIGGGQVGCNWQNSNAVWGLETDFQGSAQKDSRISSAPFNINEGPSGNVTQNIEARLRWFGTVRARAGVLVVPTVLLYGTGGLAYGNVKLTDTISVTNVGSTTFSTSSTRAGWTVGFGVEGVIPNAPAWTWKVEYLYIDLGSINGSAPDPLGGVVGWSARMTDNIVRAGINWKFP